MKEILIAAVIIIWLLITRFVHLNYNFAKWGVIVDKVSLTVMIVAIALILIIF